MSADLTDHRDDLTSFVDAVHALLDTERESVTVIWPQNASALNKAPAGLMLSAAVVLACDGCGQSVRFDGRRVEGWFDGTGDGALVVQAEWSMQHGCGTWAPPIVWTTWCADDDTFDPEALVAELRALAADAQKDRNLATERRLRRDLAEFLAARIWEPTGSETEPGIYHNGNQWVAWDYDIRPAIDNTWDTLDVTESDLNKESTEL